jgi:DNA-binding beta-propeller fold protein YncE
MVRGGSHLIYNSEPFPEITVSFNRVALVVFIALFLTRPSLAAEAGKAAPDLAVVATIPGPDGGWDFASVDSAQRRLYIAHGDAVMAVNLDTGAVTARLIDGKRLHAVVPVPDGKALSTNGGDNTATLFDGATGKMIASIPTGANPDAAIFDPSSGLVLVMDARDGDIALIDPKTGTSPGRIAVGGKLEVPAVDGHGRAFVNVEDKGEIAVIDIAGRKLVTRYALPGCEEPSGLAFNPETGVLVAACANKKAIALQSRDGSVMATLAIGERPDTTIFDAKRKLFFIPCGEGLLVAISDKPGTTPAVVATIPTQNGARTGALDEKTGRIYLPTADFAPLAPGEKRRSVIPGTFRILVVVEK